MNASIELHQVSAQYHGAQVLKDISLQVKPKSIQIVIGPSGAGKSTLLRVMNGLLPPNKGTVSILGKNQKDWKSSSLRSHIGYVPQHLGLVNSKTVYENVMMGCLARISVISSLVGAFPKKEKELAQHLIQSVGLQEKENVKVFELSGGERRRVAIARAFMQKPKILLADEILSDLDFLRVKEITTKLEQLKEEFGVTIIMVEHDLNIAKALGEHIMILREGENRGNFSSKELTESVLHERFSGVSFAG